MRLIHKVSILASTLALLWLAFPINTAKSEGMQFPATFNKEFVGPIRPPIKPKGTFNPCNCWSYVKYKRGGEMPLGYGAAKNYPINSQIPIVGAIIITYESNAGHMGIVSAITDNKVVIDDYNYEHCAHTVRELPIDSSIIKGYII